MKILVDLKPALDGYAGIPQETRLLFKALKAIPGARVDGLIQHGGRSLARGLGPGEQVLPSHTKINRLSKFVVSFHERPLTSWTDSTYRSLLGRDGFANLCAKTLLGIPIRLSVFEPNHFQDFLWRTLFDKTLEASARADLLNSNFRVITESRKQFHRVGLMAPSDTSPPLYPVVDTSEYDFFIAQTPFPGRVSPKTKLIIRYHDAVPLLYPHTVGDKARHQAMHFRSLMANVSNGASFSCISNATRSDLVALFPETAGRASVIHNIVSSEYRTDLANRFSPNALNTIVGNRSIDAVEPGYRPRAFDPSKPFLLMVSTIEPRKNHLLLIRLWEHLIYSTHPHLNVVIVGALGWDHKQIVSTFRGWVDQGRIAHLVSVPAAELRFLYSRAAVTVCPSFAEGFDYSGVEAMGLGCPVAASDIPVHREIFADGSTYFDPYSVEDAARAVRFALEKGKSKVSPNRNDTYQETRLVAQWQRYLEDVRLR